MECLYVVGCYPILRRACGPRTGGLSLPLSSICPIAIDRGKRHALEGKTVGPGGSRVARRLLLRVHVHVVRLRREIQLGLRHEAIAAIDQAGGGQALQRRHAVPVLRAMIAEVRPQAHLLSGPQQLAEVVLELHNVQLVRPDPRVLDVVNARVRRLHLLLLDLRLLLLLLFPQALGLRNDARSLEQLRLLLVTHLLPEFDDLPHPLLLLGNLNFPLPVLHFFAPLVGLPHGGDGERLHALQGSVREPRRHRLKGVDGEWAHVGLLLAVHALCLGP
mmetsp:Transcript_38740/g.121430  ORF Transcript_38740/g.121430 Transcript_38740/m.121430 type:complete len:275 (+) Transcript_38740:34-858(+)